MDPLYWESPIGMLRLDATADGRALRGIALAQGTPGAGQTAPVLEETARQLGEYFAGRRREFSLPLVLEGTEFQRRVWAVLQTIPYGETRTYAQVAALAGCPRGCRAVGMANHRNPIMIVVPCHRVVNTGGGLGGYGGGQDAKRALLRLEKAEN
ncbi:MAG: methylated-DNA--[protein]-cysteine S-methyltransferase [Gemmiger sp.]